MSTGGTLDVFGTVPVPLLVVDRAGSIVFTNGALDQLFEYDAGELVGHDVEVLVPPDAVDQHRRLRDGFSRRPHERPMGEGIDLEGVTRRGRRIAIEIELGALDLGDDEHVVASVVDVGVRWTEHATTRLAVDAAASAMILVDDDGTIVLVNREAVDMFGHDEDDLLGRSIDVLVPDRYRHRHHHHRQRYAADPTPRSMGGDRRLHGRRADGTEFPVEVGLTPIEDRGRTMTMATVIDITDRTAAEEEIERQNADLRRLNEELRQFAYSASHDLKAPLATLEGVLTCVQEDLADDDLASAIENSELAKELTHRLAGLIEGVLGLALSDRLDGQLTALDLREEVEAIGIDLRSTFDAHDVQLHNGVAPGTSLRSDRRRLRQIIQNLVHNGAKFSDPDADERSVSVSARTEADELVIVVADNGIGIPAESHDKVFTMFRRFHHDDTGHGLGLALVERQVDHLGGTISFESSTEGTTFVVRLPNDARSDDPVSPRP